MQNVLMRWVWRPLPRVHVNVEFVDESKEILNVTPTAHSTKANPQAANRFATQQVIVVATTLTGIKVLPHLI
jgi:hypothetical protein